MTPNDIRAELIRRGIRVKDIAADLQVDRSTVSNIISGKRRSRRIAEHIAARLALPYGRVFPVSKQS